MDRSSSSWSQSVKAFFNPPTQNERLKRHQQLKDTAFFVVATTLLVTFRKQILESVEKIATA